MVGRGWAVAFSWGCVCADREMEGHQGQPSLLMILTESVGTWVGD